MKIFQLLIAVMLFGLVACSKDDYDIAMLYAVNGTEYAMNIKFLSSTDKHEPKGSTLDTIQQNYIAAFMSYDESIDPCVLLSNECDSIIVTIKNPEESIIFFGKHSTPNYSFNPFKDANAWSYEVELQDDFNNVITKHIYSLVLTTDNIAENNPK